MSLIMYYRGCLTADRSARDSFAQRQSVFERATKTWKSEDGYVAGASCGEVLSSEKWKEVVNAFVLYQMGVKDGLKKARDTLQEMILKIYEDSPSLSSTLYFIMGDLFVSLKILPETPAVLMNHLDRNIPYVDGTGEYAANVLIEHDQVPDFETFFRIVARSAPGLSEEFTKIDLSEIKGTPWYKEKKLSTQERLATFNKRADAALLSKKKPGPKPKIRNMDGSIRKKSGPKPKGVQK